MGGLLIQLTVKYLFLILILCLNLLPSPTWIQGSVSTVTQLRLFLSLSTSVYGLIVLWTGVNRPSPRLQKCMGRWEALPASSRARIFSLESYQFAHCVVLTSMTVRLLCRAWMLEHLLYCVWPWMHVSGSLEMCLRVPLWLPIVCPWVLCQWHVGENILHSSSFIRLLSLNFHRC